MGKKRLEAIDGYPGVYRHVKKGHLVIRVRTEGSIFFRAHDTLIPVDAGVARTPSEASVLLQEILASEADGLLDLEEAKRLCQGEQRTRAKTTESTLAEYARAWSAKKRSYGRTARTIEADAYYLSPWIERLGSVPVSQLRWEQVESAWDAIRHGQRSPSVVNRMRRDFASLIQKAVDEELRTSNPVRLLMPVPTPSPSERDALTPKQLVPAFRCWDEIDRSSAGPYMGHVAYLYLMLSLGFRPGELDGLRREDYAPGERVIRVRQKANVATGKATHRTVPLAVLHIDLLDRHQQILRDTGTPEARSSPLVFPASTGRRVSRGSRLQRAWVRGMKAAGIDPIGRARAGYVPYHLRGAAMSLAVRLGISDPVIDRIFGHEGKRGTVRDRHYLRPTQDELRQAVELLADNSRICLPEGWLRARREG